MAYRVLMAAVGKLPVPAVQGGASEALAQALLDQNEKDPRVEFTVLSVDHPEAREQAARYQHAKFVWFSPQVLWNKFWWRIRAAKKQLTGKELPFPYQRVQAARWIREHEGEFDFILTECDLELFQYAGIGPEKLLYHLHWVGRPTPENDASFGHLIAVSDYVGREWAKATGRPMDTVHVLPNGIDVERFSHHLSPEEKAALREKLGIPAENRVLVFTGRIVPYKGVRELLAAVDALEETDVTLLVVGSANFGLTTHESYEQEMRRRVDESTKQIVFTGFVDNAQLWQYYDLADIVVMASLCEEAAPLVPIEAMAMGKPVIATRSGGIPEYLTADCGVLVDKETDVSAHLQSAMEALLRDPDRRAALAGAGQARASQFTHAAFYQNFVRILDEIAGQS